MTYSDTRVIWGPLDRALESLRENVRAAREAADVAAPRENGLTGNIREGESRQGDRSVEVL